MNRALFAVLIAVVGGALIWGLMIVGGPAQARMEKNDEERFRDLGQLGWHYLCTLRDDGDGDVIGSEQTSSRCAPHGSEPPDLRDPLSDAPYQFVRTGDNSFEVCATFEAATRRDSQFGPQGYVFDGPKGCRGYQRKDASSAWRLR